jgi:uncharacterized protein
MNIKGEAKVLRIYLSNTDKFRQSPLYEIIVFAAKRYGMAGATVLKGIMGFGQGSNIHSAKFWDISEKLPLVIEILDEPAKIELFIEKIQPWFEKLRHSYLITVEKANIVSHNTKKPS